MYVVPVFEYEDALRSFCSRNTLSISVLRRVPIESHTLYRTLKIFSAYISSNSPQLPFLSLEQCTLRRTPLCVVVCLCENLNLEKVKLSQLCCELDVGEVDLCVYNEVN